MAKVLREITHPSFDDYKRGEIVEVEESDVFINKEENKLTRLGQFSKPYTEKKVTKKAK